MSRKTKIVEDAIGLIDRELRSSRNREALEESGRRLLAQLESGVMRIWRSNEEAARSR